jgi:hypothetical protein
MGYGLDMSALMETFTEAVATGAVDDTYSLSILPPEFPDDAPEYEASGIYVFDNIYVETLDDYGWPLTWEIYVSTYDEDASLTALDSDNMEMGVIVTVPDGGVDDDEPFRIYSPYFESTEPSFSDPTYDSDGVTFTATVDSLPNYGLRDKFGGDTSSFSVLFNKYVAEVAAELYVSTAESVHTFKNIKSTEIDDETFDALEGEEAAQTISVSTTTTTTVGY